MLYEKLIELSKKDICFIQDYKELKQKLDNEKDKYDKVLFLGAGDIYDMAKKYLQERKNK